MIVLRKKSIVLGVLIATLPSLYGAVIDPRTCGEAERASATGAYVWSEGAAAWQQICGLHASKIRPTSAIGRMAIRVFDQRVADIFTGSDSSTAAGRFVIALNMTKFLHENVIDPTYGAPAFLQEKSKIMEAKRDLVMFRGKTDAASRRIYEEALQKRDTQMAKINTLLKHDICITELVHVWILNGECDVFLPFLLAGIESDAVREMVHTTLVPTLKWLGKQLFCMTWPEVLMLVRRINHLVETGQSVTERTVREMVWTLRWYVNSKHYDKRTLHIDFYDAVDWSRGGGKVFELTPLGGRK